jgi:hypothetical protein
VDYLLLSAGGSFATDSHTLLHLGQLFLIDNNHGLLLEAKIYVLLVIESHNFTGIRAKNYMELWQTVSSEYL